jgi:hypothetical protein
MNMISTGAFQNEMDASNRQPTLAEKFAAVWDDISGTNNYERLFASFVMVVGVILFSIANGALASIISSLDGQSGEYEDKLNTLILAHKEFEFPTRLYI